MDANGPTFLSLSLSHSLASWFPIRTKLRTLFLGLRLTWDFSLLCHNPNLSHFLLIPLPIFRQPLFIWTRHWRQVLIIQRHLFFFFFQTDWVVIPRSVGFDFQTSTEYSFQNSEKTNSSVLDFSPSSSKYAFVHLALQVFYMKFSTLFSCSCYETEPIASRSIIQH